jgi:hypothetical protein
MKRSTVMCEAATCGPPRVRQAATTLVIRPGARPLHFCARCALLAQNVGRLIGDPVELQEMPCAWCQLPISNDERADRDEPLHRDCVDFFDDRTDPLPS